ncbi:MotA/TolQ/ExbB proton channel family protein [Acidihalobacter prosperus]|uniref:MotA/TolQ/ExbB proton channel domain-containing protein n=1 Tax=Acidihalobacter prosperus TaxID=160660 RepID=A0A1A6C285_9GAMM|nr:MotA/TolQ/ExbB proton channel family protein [Acidihalobacter prosperus]OBS08668.1 hypothetical protein Thpro_022918 [Acidihalobacter prosperus]
MEFITHLIKLSGGLPIIMALLLLVAVAVIFDRLWFYYRVLGAGGRVEESLKALGYRDVRGLKALGEDYSHTLQGRLILQAVASKAETPDALSQHLDEEVLWSMPRLDQYLWLLDTAATLGPLLGLFGTIIGMIDTFNVLGSSGAAVKATGGIADALVSTGMGLFIAIISVLFLNLLNKRLRLAMHQLDLIRLLLINRLHGEGVKAHGEAGAEHFETRSALGAHLGLGDTRKAEGV